MPGSLALIDAGIVEADRGRAVGIWAGMSGVTTALGPFIGGWLVDSASWRWVFYLNVPLAVAVAWIVARHVPESRNAAASGGSDIVGTATVIVGLAGVSYALIEAPARGWTSVIVTAAVLGAAALIAFPMIERRARSPLVPLKLFASRQFSGANLMTLAVYTAIGGAFFLLVLQLQQSLHYSGLAAGVALLPTTDHHALRLPMGRRARAAHRTSPAHDDGPADRRGGIGVDGPGGARGDLPGGGPARRGRIRTGVGDHRGAADFGRPVGGTREPCRHGFGHQQRPRTRCRAAGRGRVAGSRRYLRRAGAAAWSRLLRRDADLRGPVRDRRNHSGGDHPDRRRRRPPSVARLQPRLSGPVHPRRRRWATPVIQHFPVGPVPAPHHNG